MDQNLKTRIEELLNSAPVILFMKGDRYMPQCGFSAKVVEVLNDLDAEYTTFDILEDEEVRQGLKEYSNWPTFPQLYVNGELVGGCDVVCEMYENGELKRILN